MNRRIALKHMAVTAAGFLLLPGCDGGWTGQDVQTENSFLTTKQQALLGELTETFIPATDTPGAKAPQVHTYIEKILADCYEESVQDGFKQGLQEIEALADSRFGQSFVSLDTTQRQELLLQLQAAEQEEEQQFYELLKDLSIQGYMTSEYVMTNIIKYEMVPGRYLGCVPVSAQPQA